MIDPRNLAEGIRWLTGQTEAWGAFGAPSTGCADLLAAAKAYQSAIASENEVLAAIDGYRTGSAGDSQKVARRAALHAAKIHAAHRVNTDTLAGFDGGYDAGWQDAIDACAKIALEQVNRDTGPRAVEIVAIAIRALKPPGD